MSAKSPRRRVGLTIRLSSTVSNSAARVSTTGFVVNYMNSIVYGETAIRIAIAQFNRQKNAATTLQYDSCAI